MEQSWPEAAVAIAGIVLVGSVIVVVVWQLMATWRARMSGSHEAAYRQLSEQAIATQARTASGLEQVVAELRRVNERLDVEPHDRPAGDDKR